MRRSLHDLAGQIFFVLIVSRDPCHWGEIRICVTQLAGAQNLYTAWVVGTHYGWCGLMSTIFVSWAKIEDRPGLTKKRLEAFQPPAAW